MSIATEIQRLQTAKENIKTAITNKGVTVPASAKVDTYNNYIGQIETGGAGDVKLFATEEEMQADQTATEGDLAVVYHSTSAPVTETSVFSSFTCPMTVTLTLPVIGNIYGAFRSDDGMADCSVDIRPTMCRLQVYTMSTMMRIEYTSNDGLTYTRTDSEGNPIDVGTDLKWGEYDVFNDIIGNFMLVNTDIFKGLYKYSNIMNPDCLLGYKINELTYTDTDTNNPSIFVGEPISIQINNYAEVYTQINNYVKDLANSIIIHLFYNFQNHTIETYYTTSAHSPLVCFNENGNCCLDYPSATSNSFFKIVYDIATNTFGEIEPIVGTINHSRGLTPYTAYIMNNNNLCFPMFKITDTGTFEPNYFFDPNRFSYYDVIDNTFIGKAFGNPYDVLSKDVCTAYMLRYIIAPTQLTLNAPNQMLANKTALGGNGVIVGNGDVLSAMSNDDILNMLGINATDIIANVNIDMDSMERIEDIVNVENVELGQNVYLNQWYVTQKLYDLIQQQAPLQTGITVGSMISFSVKYKDYLNPLNKKVFRYNECFVVLDFELLEYKVIPFYAPSQIQNYVAYDNNYIYITNYSGRNNEYTKAYVRIEIATGTSVIINNGQSFSFTAIPNNCFLKNGELYFMISTSSNGCTVHKVDFQNGTKSSIAMSNSKNSKAAYDNLIPIPNTNECLVNYYYGTSSSAAITTLYVARLNLSTMTVTTTKSYTTPSSLNQKYEFYRTYVDYSKTNYITYINYRSSSSCSSYVLQYNLTNNTIVHCNLIGLDTAIATTTYLYGFYKKINDTTYIVEGTNHKYYKIICNFSTQSSIVEEYTDIDPRIANTSILGQTMTTYILLDGSSYGANRLPTNIQFAITKTNDTCKATKMLQISKEL